MLFRHERYRFDSTIYDHRAYHARQEHVQYHQSYTPDVGQAYILAYDLDHPFFGGFPFCEAS